MTKKPAKVLIIESRLKISGRAAEFGCAGTQVCRTMRGDGVNLLVEVTDGRKKELV